MSTQMGHITPDKYPNLIFHEDGRMRVRIEQAAGTPLPGGFVAADPAPAQANMHREGWCEYDAPCEALGGRSNPKITLDDGTVIWGYECWWSPVEKGVSN